MKKSNLPKYMLVENERKHNPYVLHTAEPFFIAEVSERRGKYIATPVSPVQFGDDKVYAVSHILKDMAQWYFFCHASVKTQLN